MTRRSITKRAAIVAATAAVAVGTFTAGVSLAGSGSDSGSKPSEKQIAALFDGWNAALQTGDSAKVADLYAKDAVLLPTVSNQVRTDRAEIVDYFNHFLENKPVGKKIDTIVEVLDSNSAIDTGVYEFTLTDPETGAKRVVEARYSYTYEKFGDEWLIVNHHSSGMPES
jgi:uncharacterized protein (TIGR02246 family)